MKLNYLLLLFSITFIFSCTKNDPTPTGPILPDGLPNVEEAVFSNPTNITNPYYGPGNNQTYVYEGREVGEDPSEEIRIARKTSTKVVMGVTCAIHHDVVTKDGFLVEDTDDWIAQDDNGNLWYFGEFVVNNRDDGSFLDNEGSWEAGVDGALPGYWIANNLSLGCIKTKDINPDEPEIFEYKYYAPGIGNILQEGFENDVLVEIVELTEIL